METEEIEQVVGPVEEMKEVVHPQVACSLFCSDPPASRSLVVASDPCSYTYTVHRSLSFTEPPRQELIVQNLPSVIHVPKLPFIDPAKLKPIDLTAPLPVTAMTLNPCIAKSIHEINSALVMSHVSQPSKSRALVPVSFFHNQLRQTRKNVFCKLGVPSWSEERKLLAAVKSADITTVSRLLEDGINPNVADNKRRTPLHIAASQGLDAIVSELVSARADPNRRDVLGNTPLHLAVCRGDSRIVNILLRNGANINQKDNVGRTALSIVKSRLNTLRRDKSVSTDKLIGECQMISDILRAHCDRQVTADGELCTSAVDVLCKMMKNISTREQADEIVDTMMEKMSRLCVVNTGQAWDRKKEYCLGIL